METRLRFPRLGAALDVTVEAGGTQWRGRILDLSRDAVKVRWQEGAAGVKPGANVRLQFALRDRELPFWVTASVARTSPESAVLWFVDLEDQQFQRVKDLVDSLLQREWQQVLDELVTLTPPAGGQVKPIGTSPSKPEAVEEQGRLTPEEEASSSSSTGPDEDRLHEDLARAGINSLHFPSGGVLSPQWKEFLNGLGPKRSPSGPPIRKKWARHGPTKDA
jgi:hypothetical protein